jgi:phosphoribosylcarboxyaminoimidazole (NCAIR) mutase
MGEDAPQTGVSVGVIMGSQSDWTTMMYAVQILELFGIAHEVQIVSAHGSFPMRRARPTAASRRSSRVPAAPRTCPAWSRR